MIFLKAVLLLLQVEETSPNAPSNDVTPLTINSLPTAPDTGRVTRAALGEASLPAPAFEASDKGKVSI